MTTQLLALAPLAAFGLLALSALVAVARSHRRELAIRGELVSLRDARRRMRRGGAK